MASRFNWSRASKEASIQKYGSERLSAIDQTRCTLPRISREEQEKRAKQKKAQLNNNVADSSDPPKLSKDQKHAKYIADRARAKQEKFFKRQSLAQLSKEFDLKFSQMSPEERVSFAHSQVKRTYLKRKNFIVEYRIKKPNV